MDRLGKYWSKSGVAVEIFYFEDVSCKAILRHRSADGIQIADRPLPDRIQTACLRSADQAKSKKAFFPMLMKAEPKCWGAKSTIGAQY